MSKRTFNNLDRLALDRICQIDNFFLTSSLHDMISGAIVTTLTPPWPGPVQGSDIHIIISGSHHHQTVLKDRPSSIIFSTNNRIISPEKCPSVKDVYCGEGEGKYELELELGGAI